MISFILHSSHKMSQVLYYAMLRSFWVWSKWSEGNNKFKRSCYSYVYNWLSSVKWYSVLFSHQKNIYSTIISCRCLGCLVTYALGYFLHWPTITLIALGPPTLAVFTLFLVPESPIYLLRKDKIQIAEKTCKQLYGPNFDVATHLSEAQLNLESYNFLR